MRKFIFGSLLGLVVGTAIGAFGMLIAFPYLFPPPPATEQVSDMAAKRLAASGNFVHPDPDDPVHWGKGSVEVYTGGRNVEIFLKPDFEVGPGPDFHIYLWPKAGLRKRSDFSEAGALELGKLRAFAGSQVYQLPASAKLRDYASVVVWCKAFDQLITVADLSSP